MRRALSSSRTATLLLAVLVTSVLLAGLAAAFPDDPPDDPFYDRAEEAGACAEWSVNDEQRYLFDFMPQCAPAATDPEEASGMSVNRAWREFTTGRPDVLIAYMEGGVNWHWRIDPETELVEKVFLNAGELPPPTTPVDDGRLNVQDYADTQDANDNGFVDPEDVIVRFSDGIDDDGNGFVDDISGWDFLNDQNNPQTVDSFYGHANSELQEVGGVTDNGFRYAAVCPHCMLVPIKTGEEALGNSDALARGWLYATDIGADVIVSVTADVGYSTFMRQAVDYAWDAGVLLVAATNDFNTKDHQGGMFWPHVLPGNGIVSDSQGIPGPAANAITTTYRARAGPTSWGPKSMFVPSNSSGTSSVTTPVLGGIFALLLSYGRDAAEQGLIDGPLTNAEAIQVMRATASDISGDTSWPSKAGWDEQFGYGRPNVHAAMMAVAQGDIPPVTWFESPRWYAVFDPTRVSRVPISGYVAAPRSSSFRWTLEYGLGSEPHEDEFTKVSSGESTEPLDGMLGELDLGAIPESFWSNPFALSQRKELETTEQYTVTLRLRVTDAGGLVGEERRAIAVVHDPSWIADAPIFIGPSGESQAALADLQATGHLAIVFGDADGRVHAVDGVSGQELPGFPVTTLPQYVRKERSGIDPGHESILNNVAVGDLDGDGQLSIVAASVAGRVYVWDGHGRPRSGWPQALDAGVSKPGNPRPMLPRTRLNLMGNSAAPVLYDLDGDGTLDIIQAGRDGHLHAWRPDGSPLVGWPVRVALPEDAPPPVGYFLVDDRRLTNPPAIADLDGDGTPEIVLRNQQLAVPEQLGGLGPISYLFAYHASGRPVDGWPVAVPGVVALPGSGADAVGEGVSIPSAADVDGDGDDEIAFAPAILSPTALIDGDGTIRGAYGAVPGTTLSLLRGNLSPEELIGILEDPGNLPADEPVNFTTAPAFGRFGPAGTLVFAEAGSGAATVVGSLILSGSGIAVNNYLRVHDAASTVALPGYPTEMQGLYIAGAAVIGDVTGDGQTEIVVGSDTATLHAFAPDGGQVPGFPKFTNGWQVAGPALGDLDSDGRTDAVVLTREGYLFAWRTDGDPLANDEWWAYRHDERNTARYGTDTRPPGALRQASLAPGTANFVAPGDDWYAGQVDHYVITSMQPTAGISRSTEVRAAGPAGTAESIPIPPGTVRVTLYAVDEAGNRGPSVSLGPGNEDPPPTRTPANELPATGVSAVDTWASALALLAAAAVLRRIARWHDRAGGRVRPFS